MANRYLSAKFHLVSPEEPPVLCVYCSEWKQSLPAKLNLFIDSRFWLIVVAMRKERILPKSDDQFSAQRVSLDTTVKC